MTPRLHDRSRPPKLAIVASLLPAAALCGLGAVVLVERERLARSDALARATETAAQGKRWLSAEFERVERHLQERLREPQPRLETDGAFCFDLVRHTADEAWALVDGPPAAQPLADQPGSTQIDWTLFVPEIERLEFGASAEQAAARYGQLAAAMAGRPASRARLLLLQAGATQRANDLPAAADLLAALARDLPPAAALERVPLVFACRLERVLLLARDAPAPASDAARELLQDLRDDRLALPAGEVADHLRLALDELLPILGEPAQAILERATIARRARAEQLAPLVGSRAARVPLGDDLIVMLTQVAEPATRASVGVLGRDELARSLAQVPAAPGFALTLALDHAGNGDAIQAVAALDHDLQRLLVSGHAPSSYLDELLLPWRIAILGGVGGVALAAIASAWFAARLVRRELELARLRGELVTSISHELRTPLTSILVNAELLEDPRIDDPARHRYAGRIHESARRLRSLVERVLDFARWHRAGVPARQALLDPAALVAAAMDEMAELLRGHAVVCDVPADLPRVRADRDVLVQVLVGLLDNAVKYGGAGAPITVRARAERGASVVLEVEDRGAGVLPEERAHLFEPFFRSRRTAEQVPGVGLGLAFAQRVLVAHGGTLTAEPAAPGAAQEGLRVVLRLPAAPAGEAA